MKNKSYIGLQAVLKDVGKNASFLFLLIFSILTGTGNSLQAQYLNFAKYTWESFDTSNSDIPNNFVSEISVDKDGLLWVNTSGSNTFNIEPGGVWNHFDRTTGISQGWINAWETAGRGKYFIAGKYGYVMSFVPAYNRWDTIGIPDEQTHVVAVNSKNVALVGCSGPATSRNLYQVQYSNVVSLNDNFDDVLDIFIESTGDALVSFRSGLYRYKVKTDGTYTEKPKKLSDLTFYEIAVDGKGTIWGTCMNDGWLHSFKDGKWITHKGGPHELYFNKDGKEQYVAYNLLILPGDRVMISTQVNSGLAVYDGKSWKAYKPVLKNPADGITKIQLGPDGSIWCATSKNGLWVFRPAEFIRPRKPRKGRERDTLTTTREIVPVVFEKPAAEGKPIPYIPDPERTVKTSRTIVVYEDSVLLAIWDDQKIDGDTVSIYFNGKAILYNEALLASKDTFWLLLKEGDNEVLLFAHNLGSIPPNTAAMMLTHGKKVLGLNLSSDMNICDRIIIRRKRKDGSAY